MTKFGTYLLFDGNCATAMEFYKSCFDGELVITKLGDTPMKGQFPSNAYERVVNARLISGPIET
jgi:PhnB protein